MVSSVMGPPRADANELDICQTNLVCGLTGTFTSNLVDLEGATCSFPVGVGHEFDNALSQLELGKQENADVLLLANKASAQLLDLIQNQDGTSGFSAVNYWELCLSLVVSVIFVSCASEYSPIES